MQINKKLIIVILSIILVLVLIVTIYLLIIEPINIRKNNINNGRHKKEDFYVISYTPVIVPFTYTKTGNNITLNPTQNTFITNDIQKYTVDLGQANLYCGYTNLQGNDISINNGVVDYVRYCGNSGDATLYSSLYGDVDANGTPNLYSTYEVVKNSAGQPYTSLDSSFTYNLYNPNGTRNIFLLTPYAVAVYNKINNSNPVPQATILTPSIDTVQATITTNANNKIRRQTCSQIMYSNENDNNLMKINCNLQNNCFYSSGNCIDSSEVGNLSSISLSSYYNPVMLNNKIIDYTLICNNKNRDDNKVYLINDISPINDENVVTKNLLSRDIINNIRSYKDNIIGFSNGSFSYSVDYNYSKLRLTDINGNSLIILPQTIISSNNGMILIPQNNELVMAAQNLNKSAAVNIIPASNP
jgi:hypothetical protein